MKMDQILTTHAILPDLKSQNKEALLKEISLFFEKVYPLSDLKPDVIFSSLLAREQLGSTGIGGGIAVPHARLQGIEKMHALFCVHREGVSFQALDNEPVFVFFVLLTHSNSTAEHLKTLAKICRLFKKKNLISLLLEKSTEQEILDVLILQEELLR